jgi:hypothetical protein
MPSESLPDSDNYIDSVEALSWLERTDGKDRTVSQDSSTRLWAEDALKLVRELYAAGASKVLAQELVVEYEFEDASSLRVVLPKDQASRSALFAIEARALREMESPFDAEGERGQEFFVLGW